MKPPPVRYAPSAEGKIAYQVLGDGPIDLWFLPDQGWNLDVIWEYPPVERYLRRLASFSRLILFAPRGTAQSDPIRPGLLWEEWTNNDTMAVFDAIGSERVAIMGTGITGLVDVYFAATFPGRTRAVVLIDSLARLERDEDYPFGRTAQELDRWDEFSRNSWGTGEVMRLLAPESAIEEHVVEWKARLERGTASPATLDVVLRFMRSDVRGILSSIKAPTLVLSHAQNRFFPPQHGRYLAEHIPDARYVEREGPFGLWWLHDADGTLGRGREVPHGDERLIGARRPGSCDRCVSPTSWTRPLAPRRRATQRGAIL